MIQTERTVVPHAVSEQSLATLEPGATIVEAARMMAYLRIGALMVVEGEKLVGIFSERDALTRVLAKELDPATTTLADVMTPDPITIAPDATVQQALDIMAAKGFRHLPVIEDTRIVAIVSIRDLYRSVKDQMESDILLLAETLLQG
ncbi:MAG: CBS domain-containing protein [Rhodospirillales bacterium]|jgi:CBS domain-containing protein|nr:CBS domain-containing protein [Magnetospirillum sp.]